MTAATKIEELLLERGFEWAMRIYSPPNEAAAHYADKLSDLAKFLSGKGIGESAPSLDNLIKLKDSNPYKFDAFLEALVTLRSPEMMAAAWRMIQGMQVQALEMAFKNAESFSLTVSLKSPYAETEQYSTADIDDMTFVRHLMKSKSGDRPIINGFFALRRPKN